MQLVQKSRNLLESLGYESKHLNAYIAIFYATCMFLFFLYGASANQFQFWFPWYKDAPLFDLYRYIFHFCSFFVLAFAIPALYVKIYLKEPLSAVGLTLGDKKLGGKILLVVSFLIIPPGVVIAALTPSLQDFYPLARIVMEKPELVWVYEFFYGLVFYPAWEFFFRGVLLFLVAREFGAIPAILIQTMATALVHIGTPAEEVTTSIIGGIALGVVAIKTRSIVYPYIIHMSLGVIKDFLIVYWR